MGGHQNCSGCDAEWGSRHAADCPILARVRRGVCADFEQTMVVSMRMGVGLLEDLAELARRTGRSRNFLVQQMVASGCGRRYWDWRGGVLGRVVEGGEA